MEPVTFINALSRICKHEKKFGVYISFCSSDYEELIKAAPWSADFGRFAQLIADGQGIVLFDTEQEMDDFYDSTVGDDGPTRLNSYDGPCRVYVLTCNDLGELQTENT